MSVSSKETEEGVTSLIDSEEEEFVLAVDQDASPTFKTQSGKQYLKKYEEAVQIFPNQLRRQLSNP